jgi:CelD/BcsL family acetyltransferase involved in cellulose biosynthesis
VSESQRMRVEILSSPQELAAAKPLWEELLQRNGNRNVFLTFEWVFTLARHFAAAGPLAVVLVRAGDSPVAILPLAITAMGGLRRLGFIGPSLADYEDFLLVPEHARAALRAAFGALQEAADWDYFQFTRMAEDGAAFADLSDYAAECWSGTRRRERFSVAPHLVLPASWDAFWGSCDAKFRADSRRRGRKLAAEVGEIAYAEPQSEAEAETFLEALIAQHRIRRNARDYSQFEMPEIRAFYQDLVRTAFGAGLLSFSALRLGGRVVASHLALRYRDKRFCLVTAFDEVLRPYAPGRLLLLRMVEEACRAGVREFDMCLGDEPYKFDLKPTTRALSSWTLCRPSWRGRMAHLWVDETRPRLREIKLARDLKPLLRRAGLFRGP